MSERIERLADSAGWPPSQVFVVTYGEYSDYGISSIWLTLDEAKADAGDHGRVEVWPIGEAQRTLGTFSTTADVAPDGTVRNERTIDYADLLDEREARADVLLGASVLMIRVDQPTRERADKVFSEVKATVLGRISEGLPIEAIATHVRQGREWVRHRPRPTPPPTTETP
jgi:hypothetical protein